MSVRGVVGRLLLKLTVNLMSIHEVTIQEEAKPECTISKKWAVVTAAGSRLRP